MRSYVDDQKGCFARNCVAATYPAAQCMSGLDREDLGFVVMDETTGVNSVSQGNRENQTEEDTGAGGDNVTQNLVLSYIV